MESNKIRKTFLDFFNEKNHKIVKSAPMVVKNDPTLMFINAGMVPFKEYFLGNVAIKESRLTNTQKCIRVSGKHNDLEEVGVDTYHHTMFEMMGNWSFGDYFKKDAIAWAWELLTEVYKIDKSRLYVTVFEGDKKEGLAFDQEAYDEWKKYIDEDRILNGNKKDNFWEMGDMGPCGPCSEIHCDIRTDEERAKVDGKTLVNEDHPQVVEIWNNVFMEFDRKANGSLEKLSAQHVDTGMGFERLCMVIQGKTSNYDTDVFKNLLDKIQALSGLKYISKNENNKGNEAQLKTNIAMRVIVDHIRAVSFSIADGQLPSNTGAGYVIRRILRRAIRYGYQTLDLKEPFMYQLVDTLSNEMGAAFPELIAQKELISKVINEEEISFYRTLEKGIKRIDQVCAKLLADNKTTIEGKVAFELYDTFGFPLDLTMLISSEKGLTIDEAEFKTELEKQKNRSRKATSIDAGDWSEIGSVNEIEFCGYELTSCASKIVKHRSIKIKGKEQFQFVLNQTPFYAESGGQVGDTGVLEAGDAKIYVTDTKKENGEIVHFTDKLPTDLNLEFTAKINTEKRSLIENNHSATHLLHAALREVLGTHVEQKGSLVNEKVLRFDFSHFSRVTEEELEKIEALVNQKVRANIKINKLADVNIEDAKEMGAMALFGEKYGDKVRVIKTDDGFSTELCGGCHVDFTSEIGIFKINSESAISAGIRRIEAITSVKAEQFLNDQVKIVNQVKALLKNPKDITKSINNLLTEKADLQKQIDALISEKAKGLSVELIAKKQKINGINFIAAKIDLDAPQAIKDLAFEIKNKVDNLYMVLASTSKGKPGLSIIISENLVKEKDLNAGKIIREIAKEIKGGGGGQPFYATAGGNDINGIANALKKAQTFID